MSRQRPAALRRAFVDTSAYFALADTDETHHREAITITERLERAHSRLFATNFVVAETHALLLVRLGRSFATRFLHEIDRSTTTIVRVSASDERRARAIIFQYEDKDFSLTDAISFAVMERLHIPQAFTFDRHFAQYGLTVLNPDHLLPP